MTARNEKYSLPAPSRLNKRYLRHLRARLAASLSPKLAPPTRYEWALTSPTTARILEPATAENASSLLRGSLTQSSSGPTPDVATPCRIIVALTDMLERNVPAVQYLLQWAPQTCNITLCAPAFDATGRAWLDELRRTHSTVETVVADTASNTAACINRVLANSAGHDIILLRGDALLCAQDLHELRAVMHHMDPPGLVAPLSNTDPAYWIRRKPGDTPLDVSSAVKRLGGITAGFGLNEHCACIPAAARDAAGLLDESASSYQDALDRLNTRCAQQNVPIYAANSAYVHALGAVNAASHAKRRRPSSPPGKKSVFSTLRAAYFDEAPAAWHSHAETPRFFYPYASDIANDPGLPEKATTFRTTLQRVLSTRSVSRPLNSVVFIVNVLHRVGGVLSIVQLANDLLLHGLDVKVVVLDPDGFAEDIDLLPEPIFFASGRDFLDHFPKTDIVIGTLWSTMYYVMHLFLRRPDFLPAYFIQGFESVLYPETNMRMRRIVEDTYTLSPFGFAKTKWLCRQAEQYGQPVALVPPALDLFRFYPRNDTPRSGRRTLLTMLRPGTPWRGGNTTVEVLSRLAQSRTDLDIHVFGCTAEQLAALDLPFEATGHGAVPNEALPHLYSRADLFLDCSTSHGFGRTIAESLACGTPCVVTASGGVEDFCMDGVNTLVRPVGDVAGLVEAVNRMLDDDALYNRLRSSARESVLRFDRYRSADVTLQLLQDMWNGRYPHGILRPATQR